MDQLCCSVILKKNEKKIYLTNNGVEGEEVRMKSGYSRHLRRFQKAPGLISERHEAEVCGKGWGRSGGNKNKMRSHFGYGSEW